VAVFGTSTTPGNSEALKETQLAAAALGINVRYVEISTPDGIESAFQSARNANASAILIQSSPVLTERKEIARLALKTGLPAMYTRTDDVTAGGLVSYGVSLADLDRWAAVYVDKILKGAKPAELPIEQPTKFELMINLKTAQQIGVKIPPNVLARADKVIK
jgi:putative ABC transport system substrate-binding protein